MQRILLLSLLLFASACSDGGEGGMRFTGLVEATTVRVSAQTPGTLRALYVDEGDAVHAGDTLARITTDRLDHQLAQQDAQLAELEQQHRAAEARRAAGAVQRDNLRRKTERFRALLAKQAATQQQVDDLAAQLDAAEAELRAADASLAALADKRAQLGAGKRIVQTQWNDAQLTAPLDGTVLVRYAELGEVLGVGSPLCDIGDVRHMWTRIYLSAAQLAQVRIGQEARIFVDGSGAPLTGRVRWISEKAEFTPKSILTDDTRAALVYAAKVSVDNPDGLLKIGMPVTVRIDGAAR